MVTCSAHCCNYNQCTKCNNEKIKLFCLPTCKELSQKHGAQANKQRDTNTINKKQRTEWLHALKLTEKEMQSKTKQHYNIRMWLKYFYPSVLKN